MKSFCDHCVISMIIVVFNASVIYILLKFICVYYDGDVIFYLTFLVIWFPYRVSSIGHVLH